MEQAARASDYNAFFNLDEDRLGYLEEYGPSLKIFSYHQEKLSEDYISG